MSHTPTPWVKTKKFEIGIVSQEDDQSNGMVIPLADVFGDNREADAAFIVKAVNTHDELTEAVELLLTCVYAGYAPGNPTSNEAIAKGQAALAKAGVL